MRSSSLRVDSLPSQTAAGVAEHVSLYARVWSWKSGAESRSPSRSSRPHVALRQACGGVSHPRTRGGDHRRLTSQKDLPPRSYDSGAIALRRDLRTTAGERGCDLTAHRGASRREDSNAVAGDRWPGWCPARRLEVRETDDRTVASSTRCEGAVVQRDREEARATREYLGSRCLHFQVPAPVSGPGAHVIVVLRFASEGPGTEVQQSSGGKGLTLLEQRAERTGPFVSQKKRGNKQPLPLLTPGALENSHCVPFPRKSNATGNSGETTARSVPWNGTSDGGRVAADRRGFS
ncbi:hypothetical protein AAFF_G00237200 [Aldrovandia affinis]|uniref:Uncharacterized protein n=1 Tax=Aldrovandia affinis TaxID=143900 RepID=A0AAD7REM3_9TELE|nr:hypothetical protein AAFF_G00237200 [Aldrovandia affinis]